MTEKIYTEKNTKKTTNKKHRRENKVLLILKDSYKPSKIMNAKIPNLKHLKRKSSKDEFFLLT